MKKWKAKLKEKLRKDWQRKEKGKQEGFNLRLWKKIADENQEKMEKIFLEKPDWKKKEKHHQTVFTNGQFMTLAVVSNLWILGHLFNL